MTKEITAPSIDPDEDEEETFEPTISFKSAVESRKEQISELRQGDQGERRLADVLAKCRKGQRCQLIECPVCERRKLIARRGIPATIIKSLGLVDPMLHIGVRAIEVVGERRPLNPQKVAALAASMAEIGQQMPITVQRRGKKVILVSGRHRLASAIKLSWDSIHCLVIPTDKIDCGLWQHAENFYRNELTVLDRAEAIEAMRHLVRQKRAREGGQVARPGGVQPADLGISDSAKALGITREEIRRAKTIASIPPKVQKRVRVLGLDDNQQMLLEIANQSSEDGQVRLVEEIVERKRAASVHRSEAAVVDKKALVKIGNLRAQIRESASTIAAQRKQLQLIEDKLAVQDETVVTDERETTAIPPLGPEEVSEVEALIQDLNKLPKLKAKLAKASPVVLERVIATIRAQEAGR